MLFVCDLMPHVFSDFVFVSCGELCVRPVIVTGSHFVLIVQEVGILMPALSPAGICTGRVT